MNNTFMFAQDMIYLVYSCLTISKVTNREIIKREESCMIKAT